MVMLFASVASTRGYILVTVQSRLVKQGQRAPMKLPSRTPAGFSHVRYDGNWARQNDEYGVIGNSHPW